VKTVVRCCLLLSALALSAYGQKVKPAESAGEQILRKMEQNYAGIEDYTVTLHVAVDLDRLKVPPTDVTMYFKQPDKFHYRTSGFVMLPRQMTAMNFARLHEKFTAEPDVRADTIDGLPVSVLTLLPKDDRTHLRRIQIAVDKTRWTPSSLRMPLLDGRLMNARMEHQQVAGRWLPKEIKVTFQMAQGDSSVPNLFEQITPTRRTQPARDGSVSISYSDYRINTGLNDSVFVEENEERKLPR
jgi:outer membrane lipoprotein-sorting protein